jgi:hypothetical protein
MAEIILVKAGRERDRAPRSRRVPEGGWRRMHECSLMPTYRCRSSAPAWAWSSVKRLEKRVYSPR